MNILIFLREILNGKTLARVLINLKVKKHCAHMNGLTIDIAGDSTASYYRYLPKISIIKTNYSIKSGMDMIIDFNQPLPFESNFSNNIIFFNALYIAENPKKILAEIYRVLKPGGFLYLSSPFISNEMPEPHDYYRFTAEWFQKEMSAVGFSDIMIERMGERFSVSANILHPVFFLGLVRIPIYALAILLDKILPVSWKKNHPTPLGYFIIVKK